MKCRPRFSPVQVIVTLFLCLWFVIFFPYSVITPALLIADTFHAPGIRVGVFGAGTHPDGSEDAVTALDDELPFLSHLVEAVTGIPLVPLSPRLPRFLYEAMTDILIVGVYLPVAATRARLARARAAGTISIFVSQENTERAEIMFNWGDYRDQLIDDVDISLGHARGPKFESRLNYLRMPWWLTYILNASDKGSCSGPHGWDVVAKAEDAAKTAAEWINREGFATMLNSHNPPLYPRQELWDALTNLGASSGFGRVDAPTGMHKNMDPPSWFSASHRRGKIDFIRNYRFIITPENSRAPTLGGYNTEKPVQPHFSSTIPIYWGDTPIDPPVLNEKRLLIFDERVGNLRSVLDTITSLSVNVSARNAWFSEPVLTSNGNAWLNTWCNSLKKLLERKFKTSRRAWKRKHSYLNDQQPA